MPLCPDGHPHAFTPPTNNNYILTKLCSSAFRTRLWITLDVSRSSELLSNLSLKERRTRTGLGERDRRRGDRVIGLRDLVLPEQN